MNTIDRLGLRTLGLVAIGLLATSSAARAGDPAGTPTRLLLGPGSVVPGSPVGNVAFAPQRVVYGDTGWVMNVTMDGHLEMIVAEDGMVVYQGQNLGGGAIVSGVWLSMDSDPSGRVATVLFLEGGATAITIDDVVALTTADFVPAPGLEAGAQWLTPQAVEFDTSGHLAVFGTIIELSAPGSPFDAIVRYDVDAGGNLGNPVVLLSEHDLVAGHAIDGIGYFSDITFARNDSGQLLTSVRFKPSGGNPSHAAIVLDGVILAEDGLPSLIAGRDWVVNQGEPVALDAQGDYAYRTRIEAGDGNGFDVMVHNGAIVAIEGTPVAGVPGSKITRLHAPRLADDGTLLYLVEWSEGLFVTRQGFIVNDHLAVATLATQIEGETLAGVFNDQLQYDLSADGRRFSFLGYTAFGGWGAYESPTGPWQDLASSLPGTGGAPTLFGLGSLEPGSVLSLDLAGAVPGSVTNLVLGLSHLGLPFHGGVLVPSPNVLLFGLPVNAQGQLHLSGTLPAGLPSSLPLLFQFWSVDAGGPAGYSATNGLAGVTP